MIGRRLLELWRRRELALELLDQYDRDTAPIDWQAVQRSLDEYVSSGNWTTEQRSAAIDTWRQAVEAQASKYQGGEL
jgi:hypothetical protein